jgi:hypothetical protein
MAQIHPYLFHKKYHIFFTSYTIPEMSKKLMFSVYGQSYRATGRYDQAYTEFLNPGQKNWLGYRPG